MKKRFLLYSLLSLLLLSAATPASVTTIFMIGDSTMANKDLSAGKE